MFGTVVCLHLWSSLDLGVRRLCHFQSIHSFISPFILQVGHSFSQPRPAVLRDSHMSGIAYCNLWPYGMGITGAHYAEQLLGRLLRGSKGVPVSECLHTSQHQPSTHLTATPALPLSSEVGMAV